MHGVMNTILKSMLAAGGAVACVAGYSYAAEGWGTDFNQGLATAAAEGRTALVEFTGSDWCPPCMFVRSKILPTQAFKDFAEKNKLVLVELDFPRDESKVAPEVRAEREAISARYKVEGFPSMMVLDGAGNVYAKIVGAANSPEEYISNLQAGLDVKAAFDAKIAEAETLSGLERATALAAALRLLPEDCRDLRTDIVEEVISNDPEDTTGLRKASERKKLMAAQVLEFRKGLVQCAEQVTGKPGSAPTPEDMEKLITATRAECAKYLEREGLLPEVRQIVLGFVAESYLIEKNYAQAVEYLDKAIAEAPDSSDAPQLQQLKARLQAMQQK